MGELGFGTWSLGGNAYGPVTEADAQQTLEAAYEGGIRLFDTADIYGDGRVESLLGDVFANVHDVRFVTKAGYVSEAGSEQDFSAIALCRSLDGSLRRLRRDYVDFFLLHSPPNSVLNDDRVQRVVNDLQEKGLAKEVGVSLAHVDQYPLVLNWKEASVFELIFSLLDQRAMDGGIFDEALVRGHKIIARLPLCSGFLSGRYREGVIFPDGDTRAKWSAEQIDKWIRGARSFSFLEHEHRTLAQAALAFCLSTKGIYATIPGTKNPAHARQNILSLSGLMRITEPQYLAAREAWGKISSSPP